MASRPFPRNSSIRSAVTRKPGAASLHDWHPTRPEVLIGTRFGDTAQVHLVTQPGGARTQLTFFPDRVDAASYNPAKGDSFVFTKGAGGNEFTQNYRYDFATGEITLLTDGKSRNSDPEWSNGGTLVAYNSTRRNARILTSTSRRRAIRRPTGCSRR